jgi:signal transduction histidine kinase
MGNDRPAARVLILAPVGRDADLMCTHLERAGISCLPCKDADELCDHVDETAGAVVFTEEALAPDELHRLSCVLDAQPAWSDIPLIMLAAAPAYDMTSRQLSAINRRTNVTIIDRPVRIKSLISATQTALLARERQYQIRDLMQTLEERIHERDRFLAILGHELRNPLGAILLASQMRDPDGRLGADHVQLIERQSRHLTRIVNDLLDLSRVVSGKIVLKKQVVDLRDIARQSLQIVADAARSQNISLELCEPPEMLPASVDPVRIEQIVTNILTNAIKYTPEGGQVNIELLREDGQGVIRVRDNGVGIPQERIGVIFELFAQAENTIGRAQGGMGVGLALVRNLIELHGGTVEAKSDGVGRGSEFIARLPLTDELPVTARPAVVESSHDGAARHIVIVEDNADVRELLRLKLRRLGHDVEAVGDGHSAVETICGSRPDMALVDIGLPGMDGYEVAAQVREKLGRDVVLVAVSGFGQPEDKRRALDAGFDEHITKPADVNDIEGLLRRFPPSA